MTRRLVVLSFTWVAFFAHGLSGQLGQPTQSPPVFRADADAVELDVFVTDRQGNPVTDLIADDFRLEEDGVAQAIMSFSLVNVPLKGGAVSALQVEPDVQTNRRPEGRLYVFAIDGLAGDYALRLRRFLRRFVAEHFTSNDIAALVYVTYGQARNTQDFTGNSRLLLRAIDNIMGGSSESGPQETAPGPRMMFTSSTSANYLGGPRLRTEALRALTESLAQIRGRRKVMLYFTQGLGMDVFDTLAYSGGTRAIAFDDLHAALVAATRGGVAIYPIDPRGLTPGGSLSEQMDLRALAEATGATAIVNTNSIESGLARIVRENSTYYVLGFSSTNDRREGRFRNVRVRVSRPGLIVHTRSGYLEPLKRAKPPAMTPVGTVPGAIATALEQPLANRSVPMQVFAAPYRSSERQATVLIAQEIEAAALGLTPDAESVTADIATATLAVRFDGKVYGGEHQTRALSIRREGPGVVRVLSEIHVPSGRYQLRVAGGTRDRAGSVMYDLEVPDYTKARLSLSGVALTSPSASEADTLDLSTRARMLPGPITTRRDFDSSETVTLHTEVYEGRRNAPAHTVDLKVELRGANGRIVRTVSQQRSSRELADGMNGFTIAMPLNGTAAGEHVLHVEARSTASDMPVVSRDVPIRIR